MDQVLALYLLAYSLASILMSLLVGACAYHMGEKSCEN